jgi:hypothetical protein
MNKRGKILIFLSIVLVLLIIVALFVGYMIFKSYGNQKNSNLNKPVHINWSETELMELEINESVISYILYQLDLEELHNPPLSSNTPKIKVIVDNDNYYSEVIDNQIFTSKTEMQNSDISIYIPKFQVIRVLNSTEPSKVILDGISSKLISFEINADKSSLLMKGYYPLYQRFTGKEIDS